MERTKQTLAELREKIAAFGKENLEEMLHSLAGGITAIAPSCIVRIYLEDLTRGALSCNYATGPDQAVIREITFPINASDILVSAVFVSQQPTELRATQKQLRDADREFVTRFGIVTSSLFPITSFGKSLGVLCCDRQTEGENFDGRKKALIGQFLVDIADRLDQARKYHQQLLLSRRVDEYKKREAAGFMVRSAVRLIDKVSLASVLVPSGTGKLEILASHAENPELKAQYEALGAIGLDCPPRPGCG